MQAWKVVSMEGLDCERMKALKDKSVLDRGVEVQQCVKDSRGRTPCNAPA